MTTLTTFIKPTAVSTATKGVVYVLTNPEMPGLVKIGKTSGDLATRIRQLDTTGVPVPFECVFAVEVADINFVERRLHLAFSDHRVRQSREFFRLSPERVKAALELVQGVEVTPKDDIVETADDQQALNASRVRRGAFRFSVANIPLGATLTSSFDSAVTCVVKDDRRVEFRGEITSLSDAALKVAHEKGFTWKAIQGPSYWLYGETPLDELRGDSQTVLDDAI